MKPNKYLNITERFCVLVHFIDKYHTILEASAFDWLLVTQLKDRHLNVVNWHKVGKPTEVDCVLK